MHGNVMSANKNSKMLHHSTANNVILMLAQNAMLDIKSKFYLVNIYLLPKLIG